MEDNYYDIRMNNLQQSIVLVGLTIAITSIFLLTIGNHVFAIEYSNYTNEKLGIQFEYPSNWEIIEKTSRFDSGPDIMIYNSNGSSNLNLVVMDNEILSLIDLKEMIDIGLELSTEDFSKEFKTIEYPSLSTINDKDVGSFLITEEDKYEDFPTKYAKQFWILSFNDKFYNFAFISPTSNFDNPDNMEIRDNFIKSLKFIGDNTKSKTTSNSISRFD
jgi:hypothetical protein